MNTVISTNRRRRVFVGRNYACGAVTKLLPNRIAVIRCASCSQLKKVDARNLRKLKSCGCLKSSLIAAARTIHGGRRTPEYRSWSGMLQRCENPRNKKYPIYGGRGIRVSERYHSFESFLADVGLKPLPKRLYSLDRVDVNKGYEPGNLRWATAETQRQNQRAMIARKAA